LEMTARSSFLPGSHGFGGCLQRRREREGEREVAARGKDGEGLGFAWFWCGDEKGGGSGWRRMVRWLSGGRTTASRPLRDEEDDRREEEPLLAKGYGPGDGRWLLGLGRQRKRPGRERGLGEKSRDRGRFLF
jgi:hypothetical protein